MYGEVAVQSALHRIPKTESETKNKNNKKKKKIQKIFNHNMKMEREINLDD